MEAMDDLSLQELKKQFELSDNLLSVAETDIENLKSQINVSGIKEQYQTYTKLISENRTLLNDLQNNIKDIREYKNQLHELQEQLFKNEKIILGLTEENKKLKLEHQAKINQNQPQAVIRGISDIRQSFGFNLKKHENQENKAKDQNGQNAIKEEENEDEGPLSAEERKNEMEKLLKQKADCEKTFKENQQKVINYSKEIEELKTYLANYSNYINSVDEQIKTFNQQTKVSVIGEEAVNFYKSCGDKIKQLTKEMEKVNYIIQQVDESIQSLEKRNLKKAENLISNIDSIFAEINGNKNLKYNYLSIRIDMILNNLDDLKKVAEVLQQIIDTIKALNKQIDKSINNLKTNLEKFIESFKEGKKKMNEVIKKTLRRSGKDIFDTINKNIKNENNNFEEDICDKIDENLDDEKEVDNNVLKSSTLIGVKDFGKNIDLFKSKILFADKNVEEENKTKGSTLLRKNWHEICYVYDDYDVHDVHFELKAVGLGAFNFFNSCSIGFYLGKTIEILALEVNGKKVPYTLEYYSVDFDIHLKNLERAKVHLKYKEKPKDDGNQDNPPNCPFKQEYYGLSSNLKGQMAKFSLILKGSYDIISFKDEFFIQNLKNKKEKEYVWGGKVPEDGKRTLAKLSKNEAIWKFKTRYQIKSRLGELRDSTLTVPLGYVGGNNEIIKMDYSSPQTKNITIDEENRTYEIRFKNTKYKTGEFTITGELKNRCKGDWDVELTDEFVEKNFPKEDKKDKKKLESIARKIIADFDKEHKNSMYEYMDFTKIGRWVYNNIKYDYSCVGRTDMTAMDIYNKKIGVCAHMTRLSNALLYSLGYKVMYIHGMATDNKLEFDISCAHAWSLIKVKDKWYPFDATWNILSGKLPVCHVFQGFFSQSFGCQGVDSITFGDLVEEGKCIG